MQAPSPLIPPSQPLPHPLGQFHFPKLPRVHQPLLAEIDIFHTRHILHGRPADATGDNNGVRFEDDAVVDDFVDGEGDEVVVFDDGAFVRGIPAKAMGVRTPEEKAEGVDICRLREWGGEGKEGLFHFSNILNASRNANTTLNSIISFSSGPPTT